jgi:FAD:protein FMN transferase
VESLPSKRNQSTPGKTPWSVAFRPLVWIVIVLATAYIIGRIGDRSNVKNTGVEIFSGRTMGTSYQVRVVAGVDFTDSPALHQKIEQELKKVNQQMSTYIPDSEVSCFNATSSTEWFEVSKETAAVVATAQELSQKSDGYYDITVMPLVNAWGFGPAKRENKAVSPEVLTDLLAKVGYTKLEVRLDPPSLRKTHPELQIDLSSIAKGHGVDRVAAVLVAAGYPDYFVEIGGEVRTGGKRADGEPWKVGIETPTEEERGLQTILPLADASIATSGDYRNAFVDGGVRYSHTIDPKTGQPVQHNLASASVIADNCGVADGWATVMLASGPERAIKIANENQLDVLLILREPDRFALLASDRFRELHPDTLKMAEQKLALPIVEPKK